MFTPSMSDAEIEQAAYKDFLQLRGRIKLAFERFQGNLRLTAGNKRALHSTTETYTLTARSRNTYHIKFRYLRYTPNEVVLTSYVVYTTIMRGDKPEYIFWWSLDYFSIDRFTVHFMKRYRERYLDYYGTDLKGMPPILYFRYNNMDRRMACYMPGDFEAQELSKDMTYYVSEQGLSVVRQVGKSYIYITFLDQEKLSQYKARIYEEMQYWNLFSQIEKRKKDLPNKQALYKKLLEEPEKSKGIIRRYMNRVVTEPNVRKELNEYLDFAWPKIIECTEEIERIIKKEQRETLPLSVMGFDLNSLVEQYLMKS